jgi:branched-chain amino acid transport system ATP-binding protein
MSHSLLIDGLSAGYGEANVIESVSLEVEESGSLAVFGRNAAGKTTLLESIMGQTVRKAGRISFRGTDITERRSHERARLGIGYVPQEREVFASLSVEDNLNIVARPGPWNRERVYALFPRLAQRRLSRGGQLSGGEQQMLAIARALVTNPSLLLLDEPFEGLSPSLAETLVEGLSRIRHEGGCAMLLVEHHVELGLELADNVVVLDRGAVIWRGRSEELRRNTRLIESLLGFGDEPGGPS